ncbi:MAG: hypothetical protein AB1Y26_07745 [Cycloclasticus sp.]
MNRRKSKTQKVLWEEHRPASWSNRQQLMANTYVDDKSIHQPDKRVDTDTLRVIDDLRQMARDRDITGLAAIALRPDGRVVLLASGNAYDDNIRASGALVRLQQLLSEIEG